MTKRHSANAPGTWYVDTHCTNCAAARAVAPGLIVERGGQSVFARQPQTPDEIRMAWRARLLCPTASVRTKSPADMPDGVFPEVMTKSVYRLGYNAKSSYGAHSFLIRRDAGNAMVDAPRWTRAVVTQLEEWGGSRRHCGRGTLRQAFRRARFHPHSRSRVGAFRGPYPRRQRARFTGRRSDRDTGSGPHQRKRGLSL